MNKASSNLAVARFHLNIQNVPFAIKNGKEVITAPTVINNGAYTIDGKVFDARVAKAIDSVRI